MKTTKGDKKSPRAFAHALTRALIVAGFLFGAVNAKAQLDPGGGWSFPTSLDSWTFHDPTNWPSDKGEAPLTRTNISGALYLGDISSKYALVVDTTNTSSAWLAYNINEADGTTNLTLAAGAITFWLAPNSWASAPTNGTGPGTWAELLSVGQWTTNASFGYWGLSIDAGGTNIYFTSQSNDGSQATYLSAPIAWNTNEWHFVGLSYSGTNSVLYLDGGLATNGSGVTVLPGTNALAGGFFIGSDTNGLAQARALFDDIYTFGTPLSATDMQNIYNSQCYDFFLNPFNTSRAALISAPSTPTYVTGTWAAITGAGNLQWVSNTTSCITSSNVWITNMVAAIVGTGTNRTINYTFSIAGGFDGSAYDVFAIGALGPKAPTGSTNGMTWAWMGQGYHCNTYMLTNLPAPAAYFILGTPQDSDLDGLTDAYEGLVSHTASGQSDMDGDGVSDAVEWLQGRNPFVAGAVSDTNGVVNLDVYTPLN